MNKSLGITKTPVEEELTGYASVLIGTVELLETARRACWNSAGI